MFFSIPANQAQAQDTSILDLGLIAQLSQTNPEAAIRAIDDALAQTGPDEVRKIFDLFLVKAELLAALQNDQRAAELYLEIAGFAARQRQVLDQDPARLFDLAAQYAASAGDWNLAIIAVEQVLNEQRDGGREAPTLARTLDRLADLARKGGDVAQADRFAAQAEAARLATDDPTRSTGEGGFREVDVFYATDRARTGNPDPVEYYGYGRGALELGIATVTIPDIHEAGVIEAPSIWRLEFGPNPAKHVVLRSVTPIASEAFFSTMQERLDGAASRDIFVFIHGYNVRFEAAAKRAAQMAYDINFPGVPVLYSWPSRGSTIGYIPDTAVVRLSGRRLSRFLDDLVDRSGATTIHIVGHSMGNRALTDALELLALRRGIEPGDAPVFDQVLFAAPDVDADLFAEMLPTIRPVARRLTLYASEEDWALASSRQLHGDSPRAGQGGAFILSDTHVDSVDMSQLGEDMLAHSYFADDSSALADIVALFWRNAAPEKRCGLSPVAQESAMVPIWLYQAGICEDRVIVEVLAHLQQAGIEDLDDATDILQATVTDPQAASAMAPILQKLLGQDQD